MKSIARGVTLLAVLLTPLCAAAQSVSTTTGAINGVVTDTTQAVLPGVTATSLLPPKKTTVT